MSQKVYLFDSELTHENLLPLSFTRPVADFRVGIMTIKEKWERFIQGEYHYLPVAYLREKFCQKPVPGGCLLFISGALLPDDETVAEILALDEGEALEHDDEVIAFRGDFERFQSNEWTLKKPGCHIRRLKYVFDIFLCNGDEIKKDFKRLTYGRKSLPVPDCTRIIGDERDEDGNPMIFIEEGAQVECISLNLKKGPVYIGKNAVVMEGACLRGPLAICENVKIRMGARIYGETTFGPYCKIGGEIDNTVIFGYSNKAHDGYLGNAVIGEWCNIGAGVNASNLKNDYSKIRIWNYHTHRFMRTDLQFCGLIMGDHSKIGVNCMINTATVLGVGVNIYGSGFPRVFVPSFCEGSSISGMSNVPIKKFHDVAERVMSRRSISLTESDVKIFDKIYEIALRYKI